MIGLTKQEIVNLDEFPTTISDIFYVILIDDEPVYYFNTDIGIGWTKFKFAFNIEDNSVIIFENKKIIRKLFDFNTDEVYIISRIALEQNNNKFTIFSRFSGLVSNIAVAVFGDDIIELSEEDFIDYSYTDFYSIRNCDSACLSATQVPFHEANNELIYRPRESLAEELPICTYKISNIDPVTGEKTVHCSKTFLTKINENYPTEEEFSSILVQSPHYKNEFSLNEYPLSENCVIDRYTCELILTTFELTRPVSRVANYVEFLKLKTDFSRISFFFI